MKITFFSNYFNHHQEALCNAFFDRLGDDFTFIETEPMEEFRSKMGWGRPAPDYVLRSYESDEAEKKTISLAETSDLVIFGTAPERYIEKRLDENKLIFRYSERPLKEGRIKVLIPRLAKKFYHNHFRNRNKNIHILAASAYCASDYRFLHSYIDKCYKFGYFPERERKSWRELCKLKNQNSPVRILWAGRFLKLKRADLFLKAAARCRREGFNFSVVMVGAGEEESHLKSLSSSLGLDDITEYKGFLSPEETREEMEKADIFVMTSNFLEGWGSVIYEALSAGCAVIASHAAGATPFLVEDGVTGFVFKSGSLPSLERKLKKLLSDKETIRNLGTAAFENMQEYWNPETAAERVIELSENMLNGGMKEYKEGPLSRCEYLYGNWFTD
ncbi:MAG: glycosyltransferase family 4 protein [Lachnospiraceae bacterium]|nr:glycosyltransferase family 4 protein [Lachnospiraceae bacterium]